MSCQTLIVRQCGPSPPEATRSLLEWFGLISCETCAVTECGGQICMPRRHQDQSPDNTPLPPGEIGEIHFHDLDGVGPMSPVGRVLLGVEPWE